MVAEHTLVDPMNPAEPLAPEEIVDENVTGDTDGLSFDYVSNIDFGSHEVDLDGGTYEAVEDVTHIQITDRTG